MGGPVKYRHEYKYICNAMQNAVLKTRAKALMTGDFHAGADGSYRIRSLYFDDPQDRCSIGRASCRERVCTDV